MYPLDLISAIDFGEGELRIDFGDGDVDMYRIKGGQLEFFTGRSPSPTWYLLTPEEILQHVVLHTPVAVWLHVRLRLQAASEIRNQLFEDRRGGIMVTDPVCGIEIEEIDVPESLHVKYEGNVYYFCSHECKMQFEQNRRYFVHAA
ncbi:MAG TPA: YHS domain-containing protein [Terriglobales bacterium]|nr:YHS domain-containing protein [Terriglobales bacterium]